MNTARLIIQDLADGNFQVMIEFHNGFKKDSQAHQQCLEAAEYINELAERLTPIKSSSNNKIVIKGESAEQLQAFQSGL